MLMARQALVGPGPDGRAGYQVAMTVCEGCQQGFQEARGELVPVAEEVVEMALCDPQLIGHVDGSPCPSSECGCGKTGSTHTHVGTRDGDGDGGDTHVGLLIPLWAGGWEPSAFWATHGPDQRRAPQLGVRQECAPGH